MPQLYQQPRLKLQDFYWWGQRIEEILLTTHRNFQGKKLSKD